MKRYNLSKKDRTAASQKENYNYSSARESHPFARRIKLPKLNALKFQRSNLPAKIVNILLPENHRAILWNKQNFSKTRLRKHQFSNSLDKIPKLIKIMNEYIFIHSLYL